MQKQELDLKVPRTVTGGNLGAGVDGGLGIGVNLGDLGASLGKSR